MQNSWLSVGRECARVCVCVCTRLMLSVDASMCMCVCVRGCIAVCVTVSAAFSSKEFCSVGVKYYDPVKLLWRCCLPTHAHTHRDTYTITCCPTLACATHTRAHTHARSGNPLHKYSNAHNIHTTRWGSEAYKIFICTCQRHEAPLKLSHTHTHTLTLSLTSTHPCTPPHTHTHSWRPSKWQSFVQNSINSKFTYTWRNVTKFMQISECSTVAHNTQACTRTHRHSHRRTVLEQLFLQPTFRRNISIAQSEISETAPAATPSRLKCSLAVP